MEAVRKNRLMILATPFLVIAYGSMLYNFFVFYGRFGVVPYSYKDTYFLLVLCVLLFSIWQFSNAYYRNLREGEVLAVQNKQAQESHERIMENFRQMRELKHEIKNHLTALEYYLKDGRHDEAKAYLARYISQVAPVTEMVYHSNFLINSVVGKYIHEAKELGIRVEMNLAAEPVRIIEPDLYSLFSNILSNAVEACALVPERGERFMKLTIMRREPYLNIICKNSKSAEISYVDDKVQSIKQGSGHGYGLRTIERIVKTYDGLMDINYDKETFTITIALKD